MIPNVFSIRFYPSTATAIATRILNEELDGQTYDEEDAKEWSLKISDRVREAVAGSFVNPIVVLIEFLLNMNRNPIISIIFILLYTFFYFLYAESLNKTRYKVVVQTTLGQMKDQSVRIASRCLWGEETDNYASASFKSALSLTLKPPPAPIS